MRTSEKTVVLSTCTVFAGVPPTELALLAEMMQTEHLRDGEILFAEGELADRIYVVAKGQLEVFLPGELGPVRMLKAGDLLGEYALFTNRTRTATIKAVSAVTLMSLDYTRFQTFLRHFPEATLILLKTTVERLISAESRHAQTMT